MRHKHSVYKCRICGGPVSDNKAKGKGRCPKCYWEERRAAEQQRWKEINEKTPHFCVICGKQFEWTPTRAHKKTETCSRHCAGLLRTSRLKESAQSLEDRLLAYIMTQGRYITMAEMCRVYGFSEKYMKERHLRPEELNLKAGTYTPKKVYSKEELESFILDKLRENYKTTRSDILRYTGLTGKDLTALGVCISAIRKENNIQQTNAYSKDEIRERIVEWLKSQPSYCPGEVICKELHLSFRAIFTRLGLKVQELNRAAGHTTISKSYLEDSAYRYLCKAGFAVERQKTFPGCVHIFALKYDFWLPEYQLLIEVDGQQHYVPGFRGYDSCTRNDKIKESYAESHGYKLMRIRTSPGKTFKQRFGSLIEEIKGLPRVSEEVHTDSNCGELRPDKC